MYKISSYSFNTIRKACISPRLKHHFEVNVGDAQAALLAVKYAISCGCIQSLHEWDFLIISLAFNKAGLFTDWYRVSTIEDVHQYLQYLQN
jgi:hypothetical protein